MKKLLLILVASLLLGGCGKDKVSPDDTINPNDMEAYAIPVESGSPNESKKKFWGSEKYDDYDRLIERRSRPNWDFEEIANPVKTETFTYDNDRLIEKVEAYTNKRRYKYLYDNAGRIVEIQTFYSNPIPSREVIEYRDEKKYKSSFYSFIYEEVRLTSTQTYTYDLRGNNIMIDYHFMSNGEKTRQLFKYNENNDLVEHSFINSDGDTNVLYAYAYTYDAQGRVSEYIKPVKEEFIKEINSYTDGGKLITKRVSRSTNMDGTFKEIVIINYNY